MEQKLKSLLAKLELIEQALFTITKIIGYIFIIIHLIRHLA